MKSHSNQFSEVVLYCIDHYSKETLGVVTQVMNTRENVILLSEIIADNPNEQEFMQQLQDKGIFEYKYPINQKFKKVCYSYPIDYQRLNELLNSGADVNAIDEAWDDPLISNIIGSFFEKAGHHVSALNELILFFADKGWDPNRYFSKKDNSEDLVSETVLSEISGILNVEEDLQLLTTLLPLIDNTVLSERLDWEEENEYWNINATYYEEALRLFQKNPQRSLVMETAYAMLERFLDLKDYKLGVYHNALGKTVDHVYFLNQYHELPLVYDYSDESGSYHNVRSADLLFDCEGTLLYVDANNFMYVETADNINKAKLINADSYFSDIVGNTITNFSFYQKGSTFYHVFGLRDKHIHFSNGKTIILCENTNIETHANAPYYTIE